MSGNRAAATGSFLSRSQRRRRARHRLFWRLVNPPTRPLAGVVPWWVLLETSGRRSGKARRTPLARGPSEGTVTWLIAVHGGSAGWVQNLEANPAVRIRINGRWHHARARPQPYDVDIVSRFNGYARAGPRTFGMKPLLVRVELGGPTA
jgi:deazaflavin-dependent oxidoreductase (nitroreductase family)